MRPSSIMRPLVSSFRSLCFGLTLPLRAASLIARTPTLLAASVVPLLLSIGLDAWIIHGLQTRLSEWIRAHAPGSVEWIAQLLAWIVLFVVGVLAFTFIAGIAALPFNDWLAELTESRATPALKKTPHVGLLGKAKHLLIDLLKTLCALLVSGLALLCSWIPGLNLASLVLAFLLIAFQFLSYPQTRRGLGVGAGFAYLLTHFWACLGFGMSFAFLFALPLVSSLALPLAVVGGTLLYARFAENERQKLPIES